MGSTIAAGFVQKKAKGGSDRALNRGSYESAFGQAENILLSYDDLVASGRIADGSKYYGISGGESRLSQALGAYEQSLVAGSDVFRGYRDLVSSGLNATSGIPDDLRRSITEELRQAQASRGIVDSNVAATEEVVRLMGGQEAVRAQRLAQAQEYFGSVLGSGIQRLAPDVNSIYASELQRSIERARGRREAAIGGGQVGSSVLSSQTNIV